jgi:hypothetical protein
LEVKVNWKRIEDSFSLLFAGDMSQLGQLVKLGLSAEQIENGILAGFAQMIADGSASRAVCRLFDQFQKDYPISSSFICSHVLPPERKVS